MDPHPKPDRDTPYEYNLGSLTFPKKNLPHRPKVKFVEIPRRGISYNYESFSDEAHKKVNSQVFCDILDKPVTPLLCTKKTTSNDQYFGEVTHYLEKISPFW